MKTRSPSAKDQLLVIGLLALADGLFLHPYGDILVVAAVLAFVFFRRNNK